MRALVTGAAGFIGSTLCEHLLERGHAIVALDRRESSALARLAAHARVQVLLEDLCELPHPRLRALVEGVDCVHHLAGRAGVRESWSDLDGSYARDNLGATQRLLSALPPGKPLIFASSSSVYGDAQQLPAHEQLAPAPLNPYGVSKAAAELLACAHARQRGLAIVCLRLFSVYGPRQRPGMLVHEALAAGLAGRAVTLLGSGEQRRDLTYVGDVVEAFSRAAERELPAGSVINIGGGANRCVHEILAAVSRTLGDELRVDRRPAGRGEARATLADITRARELLDWTPRTALDAGIAAQLRALRSA